MHRLRRQDNVKNTSPFKWGVVMVVMVVVVLGGGRGDAKKRNE